MAGDTASSLPPGPRLPSWFQALLLTLAPLRFMETCRRRYGDIVTLKSPSSGPWVIVFDPEFVRQIFRAPADRLSLGARRARLTPVIGERSMALSEREENVYHRRLVRPVFQGEYLQESESLMNEATDRVIRPPEPVTAEANATVDAAADPVSAAR